MSSELKSQNKIRIRFTGPGNEFYEIERNVGQSSFEENEEFLLRFHGNEGTEWFMFEEDIKLLIDWLQNSINKEV